jgi:hypothetical protein
MMSGKASLEACGTEIPAGNGHLEDDSSDGGGANTVRFGKSLCT